jgi:hypothetical protein
MTIKKVVKLFIPPILLYPFRAIKRLVKEVQIIWHKHKLKKCAFTNLKVLSHDIPDLITPELYMPNDFYHHALNLKKFVGLDRKYQLKCTIEHGAGLMSDYWECDINNELPGIICMSEVRKRILENGAKDKEIFTIGPYIAYVDSFLSEDQINNERKRLGKNILFFPVHSTHHVLVNYNVEETCKKLKYLARNFDSIRICLYWKDILLGYHIKYQTLGFECVCAGHIYDEYFLPRLRSLIAIADMTISNGIGTYIGYSIYMNRPHCLFDDGYSFFTNDLIGQEDINNIQNSILGKEITPILYECFADNKESITTDQYQLVDSYWGTSSIMTKDSLKEIFSRCENLYQDQVGRQSKTNA